MSAVAEQTPFDWRFDSASYSGSSDRLEREVTKYSSDVSRVRFSAQRSTVEPSGDANGRPLRESTDLIPSIEVDDQVASLSKRFPQRPIYHGRATLAPSQEWEGYVDSINDRTFFVKLCNVKDGSGLPVEEGEFELRELSEAERSRLEVGSIIRWVVGFERKPNDQRQKVSRLHLRRLPVFRASDIVNALAEAEELLSGLVEDDAAEI